MFKAFSASLLFVATLNQTATIPIPEHAKVFADFSDKSPAVVSFFTRDTEQTISNFYQTKFGQPVSTEQKRGRLKIVYESNGDIIRVIIAPQAKYNEVNVLQMKKPS